MTFNSQKFAAAIIERRSRGHNARTMPGLREVSAHLGISPATLSRMERGTALPDLSVYIKICAWLDVSLDTFVEKEVFDE